VSTDWLPDLILLEQFSGDWNCFFETVYRRFQADFETSKPKWPGKQVKLKWIPVHDGRSATFWHMISEGAVEDERTPDLRRCERIAWPKAIMEEYDGADPGKTACRILWWKELRGNEPRYHLTTDDFAYLMVVVDRSNYVLPWTAYPVEHSSQREKLRKRWKAFWHRKS